MLGLCTCSLQRQASQQRNDSPRNIECGFRNYPNMEMYVSLWILRKQLVVMLVCGNCWICADSYSNLEMLARSFLHLRCCRARRQRRPRYQQLWNEWSRTTDRIPQCTRLRCQHSNQQWWLLLYCESKRLFRVHVYCKLPYWIIKNDQLRYELKIYKCQVKTTIT
jgi:hypothetical protein